MLNKIMGIFWRGNRQPRKSGRDKTVNINGYILDAKTMILIQVPIGLEEYIIPSEVRGIDSLALQNAIKTARLIDLSNIRGGEDIKCSFNGLFRELREIKFPDSLESFKGVLWSDILERRGKKVIFNIPKSIKTITFFPIYNEEVILHDGILKMDNIEAINALKKIRIPGTLSSEMIPEIYRCIFLESLIIGEGIKRMNHNHYSMVGLRSLVEVEIPSTLDEFFLGDIENDARMIGWNDWDMATVKENIHREIKLHKTYPGNKKITFIVIRSQFRNVRFEGEQIIFNDSKFTIDLHDLQFGETYFVDIQSKKFIREEDRKKSVVALPELGGPAPEPPVEPPVKPKYEFSHTNVPKTDVTPSNDLSNDKFLAKYLFKKLASVLEKRINGKYDYDTFSDGKEWFQSARRNTIENILNHGVFSTEKDGETIITHSLGRTECMSIILSHLRNNGIETADGYIKDMSPLPEDEVERIAWELFDKGRVKCEDAYVDMVLVDYIIRSLLETEDERQTILNIYSYVTKPEDYSRAINNYIFNLKWYPEKVRMFVPVISPELFKSVITYWGRKEFRYDTIIKYVEKLKKEDGKGYPKS